VDTVLCKDGVPACPILMINGAANPCNRSATELKTWLDRMSGGKFAVQPYRGVETPGIILGTAAEFSAQAAKVDVNLNTLGREGYRIVADGTNLWILSTSTLGVEHGVYALLDSLGCRWLWPNPAWYVIPAAPTLRTRLNVSKKPEFDNVNAWYGIGEPWDVQDWNRKNNMPRGLQANCGEMWELISSQTFDKHPEWSALVGGKRVKGTQVCVSNVELQQYFIDYILREFRADPALTMASVEPCDGGNFCECANCKRIGRGTASDQTEFLANVVARAVSRSFPGQIKAIGNLTYGVHNTLANFPLTGPCPASVDPQKQITFTQFEPNVYKQFTNGFSSMSVDEGLKGLRAQGLQQAGTYEYFVYTENDKPTAPATRFYAWAALMRHYRRDLNVTTLSLESQASWGPDGPGFWMTGRLCWDPTLDPDALLAEFCGSAFGAAHGPMETFYRRLGKGIGFNQVMIKDSLVDLQAACRLARDPAVVVRLDHIAMWLHHMRLMDDHQRAVAAGKPREAIDRIDADWIQWLRSISNTGTIDGQYDLFWQGSHDMFQPNNPNQDKPAGALTWRSAPIVEPTHEQVAAAMADDLAHYAAVPYVELIDATYSQNLTPVIEHRPDLVKAWGAITPKDRGYEHVEYYFSGRANEELTITARPFPGQDIGKRSWSLSQVDPATGKTVSSVGSGTYVAGKDAVTTIRVTLPATGLFYLHPHFTYWSAGFCELSPSRPVNMLARAQGDYTLHQWNDMPPVYFLVPAGTQAFFVVPYNGSEFR
jgi:hypothetical protein